MILIAGPCVIESYEMTFNIAIALKRMAGRLGIPFLFKASYDKANRTSIKSFRGPGLDEGLKILACIKDELKIEITSDVHRIEEVEKAAEVLDVLQIPAFLFRQTDLVLEVARTGKAINIKKGQFAGPDDMFHAVEKIRSIGNNKVVIIERGTFFGYGDLVVDMRSIALMRHICPVIFDATHSSRDRKFAPALAKAAVAAGADGVFIEVHPDPDKALCDGPSSLRLSELEALLIQLQKFSKIHEEI